MTNSPAQQPEFRPEAQAERPTDTSPEGLPQSSLAWSDEWILHNSFLSDTKLSVRQTAEGDCLSVEYNGQTVLSFVAADLAHRLSANDFDATTIKIRDPRERAGEPMTNIGEVQARRIDESGEPQLEIRILLGLEKSEHNHRLDSEFARQHGILIGEIGLEHFGTLLLRVADGKIVPKFQASREKAASWGRAV